jgi:DNA-binding MarR family transcriptional regulator
MSQKSSLPQVIQFVSEALMPDILALLWMARHPYGSKAELEKYLGASQGSVSRAVRYWMNRPGGGSERFIESYEDAYDRRRRRLRLTPLGSRFVNDFIAA